MFDNLSLKLEQAFKTLKGQGQITEINVASTVKEIRKALVDADVNYKVAKQVTDTIREKALGRDVLIAVSPGQLLVKIVYEELAEMVKGVPNTEAYRLIAARVQLEIENMRDGRRDKFDVASVRKKWRAERRKARKKEPVIDE